MVIMDWEDRLDDWEVELELGARLEGSDWVTLEKAAAETGASRAALRTWYRSGQIPSRLVDGPHGPQRLVPLAMVADRAEASPRVRKTAERRLADEAQLELLRHRVDQLELRLADLERRLANGPRDLHPPTRRHWLSARGPAGRLPFSLSGLRHAAPPVTAVDFPVAEESPCDSGVNLPGQEIPPRKRGGSADNSNWRPARPRSGQRAGAMRSTNPFCRPSNLPEQAVACVA
jgi:transposase